ncbi:MAG: STAS domain-containing protein [Methanomassiliicoccales archaeon]
MRLEKMDEVAVIYPGKNIDISNSSELRSRMEELMDEGCRKIILDLTDVAVVDSSGIGKLLVFYSRFEEHGGVMVMRNVNNAYLRKLFSLISFDQIIKVE